MPCSSSGFNPTEKRVVLVLGATYMVRMLGLFMSLPVLVLASKHFADATPLLVGLALGAYGLPQALMQIPFGLLSDFIGRKPAIIAGFSLFIIGSLVASAADTIVGLIGGRVLQGMGAVASVIMALATDIVREQQRSRALAFIGVGIGLAFMLALIIGPLIGDRFGLSGIFRISALLGVVAIILVAVALPPLDKPVMMRDGDRSWFATIKSKSISALRDRNLWRLDISVFFLHLVLTSNFFLLPNLLEKQLGLEQASHWIFYAPVLMGSFLLILPFLRLAEKWHRVRGFLLGAVALIGVAQVLAFFQPMVWLSVGLVMALFFAAFNYLEASLPALVSRFCAGDMKGVSMGMFSNGQFLGTFTGGLLAGGVASVWDDQVIYLVNAGLVFVWLVLLVGIDRPRHTNGERGR